MNVYFYEVTSENYSRYVVEVALRISAIDDEARLFFIRDKFVAGKLDLPLPLIAASETVGVKDLAATVRTYPPDVFICFGHRLPDVYWTYWFKRLGARTAQVQHGLYSDRFPKSVGGLLSSPRRKIRYLRYLAGIVGSRTERRLGSALSILRKDLPFSNVEASISEEMMPDRIFVWGEYWKAWYRDHLFYNSDRVEFITCGSFDALILRDEERLLVDQDGVGYICQTLVEDGRMAPRMFAHFLDNLLDFVERESVTLYLRPHPRSDLLLYSRLLAHPRVQMTHRFPYTGRYIGHYSALLGVCFREDTRVLLVHFPKHELPEHFRRLNASHRWYTDRLDLAAFDEVPDQGDLSTASFYSAIVDDPYATIAEEVAAMVRAQG